MKQSKKNQISLILNHIVLYCIESITEYGVIDLLKLPDTPETENFLKEIREEHNTLFCSED